MLSNKTKRELKIDQRQILIDSIEVGIPSPEQILTWGERVLPNGKKVGCVKNSKTVNYKRFTPFRDGLFCERIFGPVTSFVCACGKKQPHSKVTFCEKCEVEYIDSRSRRYRLGYIPLLSPVTHIWYLKGRPSYLSLFLAKRKKTIVALAYCNAYLIEHSVSKKNDNVISLYMRSPSNTENFLRSKTQYGKSGCYKAERCIALPKVLQDSPGVALQHMSPLSPLVTAPVGKVTARSNSPATESLLNRKKNKKKSFAPAKLQGLKKPFARQMHGVCNQNGTSCFFCSARTKPSDMQKFAVPKLFLKDITLKNQNALEVSVVGKFQHMAKQHQTRQQRQNFKTVNDYVLFARRTNPVTKSRALLLCNQNSEKRKSLNLLSKVKQRFVRRVNNEHRDYLLCFPFSPKIYKQFSVLKTKPVSHFQFKKSIRKRCDKKPQARFNPKVSKEVCTHNLSKRARSLLTSYGTCFYARQHTLPFLPALVSHFYLRDALVNFTYSIPGSDDIPLIEYCHIKRWEPLRDVHKFMAHKTVESFKNDSSYNSARLKKASFRESEATKGLRGYRTCFKQFFDEKSLQSQPCAYFRSALNVHSSLQAQVTCFYQSQPGIADEQKLLTESFLKERKIRNCRQHSCKSKIERAKAFKEASHTHFKNVLHLSTSSPLNCVQSVINARTRESFAKQTNVTKGELFAVQTNDKRSFSGTESPTSFSEETNKAALSGLELTAIREILSYTGGGALQQLLQQVDQHDLCKFLFAEAQILRVLYETRSSAHVETQKIVCGSCSKSSRSTLKQGLLQTPITQNYVETRVTPSLVSLQSKSEHEGKAAVSSNRGVPSDSTERFCLADFCKILQSKIFRPRAYFCKAKVSSFARTKQSFVRARRKAKVQPYNSIVAGKTDFVSKFGVAPQPSVYSTRSSGFGKQKRSQAFSKKICSKKSVKIAQSFALMVKEFAKQSFKYKHPLYAQSPHFERNEKGLLRKLAFADLTQQGSKEQDDKALPVCANGFPAKKNAYIKSFRFKKSKSMSSKMNCLLCKPMHVQSRALLVNCLLCKPICVPAFARLCGAKSFAQGARLGSLLQDFALQNLSHKAKSKNVAKSFGGVAKQKHAECLLQKVSPVQKIFPCSPDVAKQHLPPLSAKMSYPARKVPTALALVTRKRTYFAPASQISKPATLLSKKSFYEDFQNETPELQKRQILRIARRIYKVARRLKIVQLLSRNHRKPEWMILSHLPVLPPDLRPILQMSEKVIVASDLNIMYQRVIYRNNRHLRVRFIDFHLVTAIQRLVQDAVDRLIENGKGGSKPYSTQNGRPLKSLSEILKGKKGRFRLNLLGKRVDFSGRSVIVVSPLCQIHECGLPKDIALELYHYFLLRQLIVKKYCASIVTAKKMIKSKSPLMWDLLRELMYHHPVLLNRAPTLHRLGIQAFQPKLVLGNAILLHPLVCSGFNADFDGDQMGVHLPLSFAARAESWDLLWSRNNLLSPATGQPMLVPSQDMVLGFYYMTAQAFHTSFRETGHTHSFRDQQRDQRWDLCGAKALKNLSPLYNLKKSTKRFFPDMTHDSACKVQSLTKDERTDKAKPNRFLKPNEITQALQTGQIKLHTPVWLYWNGKIENEEGSQKPLEMRVHGFGLQRSIYEKHIFLGFFTKTKATIENKATSPGFILNGAKQSAAKQNACKTRCRVFSNQKHNNTRLVEQSFLICTQPESYYVRTTPGRVLINNLIQV